MSRSFFPATERPLGTREQILETASEMLLAEGYKSLSMEAIAQAVGLSRAAIYLHFKEKKDLLLAMIRHMSLKDAEVLREIVRSRRDPLSKLRTFLRERMETKYKRTRQCGQSLDEFFADIRQGLLAKRAEAMQIEAGLLAEVLIMGRLQGAFEFDDAYLTAEAFLLATNAFSPYSLTAEEMLDQELFNERLGRVIEVCVKSVATRYEKPLGCRKRQIKAKASLEVEAE